MRIKNILRLSLILATTSACSYGAPFMAIGDGAELFLTGALGVRVDDNIFLAGPNTENDMIFDLGPGIDLTFGKDAQLQGSLTLVHTFSLYADNSNLDTNLFTGDFVTRYDDGKLKLGFDASFHEVNQNDFLVRGLVRRDIFKAGGNAEVEVSAITAVGAGIMFEHLDYKRFGYADVDYLTVPVNFYYKWTPKTDLSAGYQYRDTQVDLGSDSTDHFFNIGARGEFSPMLTGKFAIGYNMRDLDQGGDEDGLGLQASFAYELSPKTTLEFGASRDFGTGARGEQQENTVVNSMVIAKIAPEWTVNAGLSFRQIEYATVTDDYWEAQIGTDYIINANVRLVGAYVYRKYESDSKLNEFRNNVFSFGANFRY
jgi:polysaccharide biosynthesis protein VpsM